MKNVKDGLRRVRRLPLQWMGRDVSFRAQIKVETRCLGKAGGIWCVCPQYLSDRSVVYSFGIGEDISFEAALLSKYSMMVNAFDPTPRSIQWIKTQPLPERFIMHEFGIADYDGVATFHAPENENHVSYSLMHKVHSVSESIEAPVYRLRTIMEKLGHDHIGLLKIDIEGAEYDVIADVLRSKISVKQLLIEFHHRWKDIGAARTHEAICALNAAGYKIFHVSATGMEYSFLATADNSYL
jgi:FkbM family methyltransferase